MSKFISGREVPIDEKDLHACKDKILKSGLFLLDDEKKPTAMFKLKSGNSKKLCVMRSKVIPGIDGLAVRVMTNKLSGVILRYLAGPPDSFSYVRELQDLFETDLVRLLHNYNLEEKELQPRYTQFRRKVNEKLKEHNEQLDPKPLSKTEMRFYLFIRPLYAIFEKYLTDQEKKKLRTNQTDIYHYIAHLLIACGLEKRDRKRGHWPVFEKIRQYAYRSGHVKYMGRARPY